ncbi:MAG TPA: ACP S-malonyltransferase [Rhizomicrobium sp.]|nr:ACP S-malonyltransferase [Rhizomicrobium sp.]
MTRAFIFPGQGSQAVGMGKALADAFAAARETFQEVDEALGQSLSRLMWEGPESDLVLTENAQPAIMAASLAVIAVLRREAGLDLAKHARLVAGHSLGEYSALAAAGAFTLADAARLLKARGRAMQQAVPVGEGGMSALLGAEIDQAEALAKECAASTGGICVVANDNAPGQVVISGTKAAIDRAPEIAKSMGIKRAMAQALAAVTIRPLAVPVVANVTAAEVREPDSIRRLLVEQVTARVRWRESVLAFRALGVETTVEAGGAKVLTGMVKRIDKELQTVTLDTPADIEAFARTL